MTAVRGESGVAGEGKLVALPNFHSWGKCTMPLLNIQLDWMSNTSSGLYIIYFLFIYMSKVTTPQVVYRKLVLHVYLGSNPLEFSAIHR